jgi:hypothetical protein
VDLAVDLAFTGGQEEMQAAAQAVRLSAHAQLGLESKDLSDIADTAKSALLLICQAATVGDTRTYFEPEMGLEPMTCALRVRCSTTELPGPGRIPGRSEPRDRSDLSAKRS